MLEGFRYTRKRFKPFWIGRHPRLFDIHGFLGLCNYYRRFMKGFSQLSAPLRDLTKNKIFPLGWEGITHVQQVEGSREFMSNDGITWFHSTLHLGMWCIRRRYHGCVDAGLSPYCIRESEAIRRRAIVLHLWQRDARHHAHTYKVSTVPR